MQTNRLISLLCLCLPMLMWAQTKTKVYTFAANESPSFLGSDFSLNAKGEAGYLIPLYVHTGKDSAYHLQTPKGKKGAYLQQGAVFSNEHQYGVYFISKQPQKTELVELNGNSRMILGEPTENSTFSDDGKDWVAVCYKDSFDVKEKRNYILATEFHPKNGKSLTMKGYGYAKITTKGWIGLTTYKGKGYLRHENGKIEAFPCISSDFSYLEVIHGDKVRFTYRQDANTIALYEDGAVHHFPSWNTEIIPAEAEMGWVKVKKVGVEELVIDNNEELSTKGKQKNKRRRGAESESQQTADSLMAYANAAAMVDSAAAAMPEATTTEEDWDDEKDDAVKGGERKTEESVGWDLHFSNGQEAKNVVGLEKASLHYDAARKIWFWLTIENQTAYLHNSKGEKWGPYACNAKSFWREYGSNEDFVYPIPHKKELTLLFCQEGKCSSRKITGKFETTVDINGKTYTKVAEKNQNSVLYSATQKYTLPSSKITDIFASPSFKTYGGMWDNHLWISDGYSYPFPILGCDYDENTKEVVWLGLEEREVYLYRMKIE
ncbi:MAG: hypothetical protein ACKVTZ_01540 [Bacteroidia bacterium]